MTKNAVAKLDSRSIQAAAEIRGQVNMVQAVMGEVMKKDVHFGTIPGTPKPTLYQAGAQVLCATFHFRPDYEVMEREVGDGLVRYSVKCRLFHQQTGIEVATGVGTCSSGEAKYMWRRPICKEEFDETPEDQRRKLWKKGYQGAKPTQDMQVRTNPADQENTILKMASKRAYIQAVLNATAASDMFTQDVEDLPEGYVDTEVPPEVKKSSTVKAKVHEPEIVTGEGGEILESVDRTPVEAEIAHMQTIDNFAHFKNYWEKLKKSDTWQTFTNDERKMLEAAKDDHKEMLDKKKGAE